MVNQGRKTTTRTDAPHLNCVLQRPSVAGPTCPRSRADGFYNDPGIAAGSLFAAFVVGLAVLLAGAVMMLNGIAGAP